MNVSNNSDEKVPFHLLTVIYIYIAMQVSQEEVHKYGFCPHMLEAALRRKMVVVEEICLFLGVKNIEATVLQAVADAFTPPSDCV